MKILNIICSYNTPELTKRVYNELKNQTVKAEIMVLENSNIDELYFDSPETVNLGKQNIGFGGMHDWIFSNKDLREYDFVAIYNNDVFNIPTNFVERLEKYLHPGIGIACPALDETGTGWQHMKKKGNYFRTCLHCEDAIGIFNTKLFPIYERYLPVDYYGVLDISLCVISSREGFTNIIIDELAVFHMLSGARKEAGVNGEYLSQAHGSLLKWHNEHKDLKELYDDYIRRYNGVSVIIPNYNHNNLLRRAVDSVLRQPIAKEVIVVDDCSPNQDYSMLDGLANVKLVRHDVNNGLASARNTGIKESYHEWILPLDADDAIKDNQLAVMFDNRKADIIHGDLEFFNGGILRSKPTIDPMYFLQDNQLVGSSLYHKDVWRNVNGYNEEYKEYFEDWCFWGKASMRGYKFHYIPEAMYYYHGAGDGMCARLNQNRQNNIKLVSSIIAEYKEWLEKQMS